MAFHLFGELSRRGCHLVGALVSDLCGQLKVVPAVSDCMKHLVEQGYTQLATIGGSRRPSAYVNCGVAIYDINVGHIAVRIWKFVVARSETEVRIVEVVQEEVQIWSLIKTFQKSF